MAVLSGIRRAVVTGGAGFIGSHVVDALADLGASVAVVDELATGSRENLAHLGGRIDFECCDVNETARLAELFAGADCVFHLAGLTSTVQSLVEPETFFRTNTAGTLSVMEAARAAGVPRVVYAASSSCYGIPDHCPISEDAPIRHEYPYGLTKYLGEQIVLHWAKAYAMSNVSLRLFNVFGPRMNEAGGYGSVLAVFLAQRRRSQPLTITGDGSQSRDFTYATDVARAFILAAQSRSSGEAFNIGTGKPQTVNRLAEVVGGPVVYVPKRVREPESHFADATKAQKFLGWRPEVTFEEGIERVLSLAGSASS